MDWRGLAYGELRLTFDILSGLFLGFIVLRTGLADKFMRRMMPHLRRAGIGPVLGMALTMSLGSPKAGAAYIASALDNGKISEPQAKWGTLLLSFPAYLRRWPSTFIMSASMAGISGAIFAIILVLRSAARFVWIASVLKRGGSAELECEAVSDRSAKNVKFNMKLLRTLPIAWFFFAIAYMLVPWAEEMIKRWLLAGTVLPLAALMVAAASIAHVSAALALAGGSLAAGDLNIAQAVFALLLGNSFGIVTRLFRQNAGYYFGLFSKKMAQDMLIWNFITTAGFALISLVLAALPLFIYRI